MDFKSNRLHSINSAQKVLLMLPNKVLELKPDGVVLAPFFKKEASVFIEELKELEIPFVFIDSDFKRDGPT